jgi:hypothetical protein
LKRAVIASARFYFDGYNSDVNYLFSRGDSRETLAGFVYWRFSGFAGRRRADRRDADHLRPAFF